jgi:hypothetical protein
VAKQVKTEHAEMIFRRQHSHIHFPELKHVGPAEEIIRRTTIKVSEPVVQVNGITSGLGAPQYLDRK